MVQRRAGKHDSPAMYDPSGAFGGYYDLAPAADQLPYAHGQLDFSQPSGSFGAPSFAYTSAPYDAGCDDLSAFLLPNDYADVNSLEPSLLPQHMYEQQQHAPPPPPSYYPSAAPFNTSPTASSHASAGSEESDDFAALAWHPYKRSPPAQLDFDARTKRGKLTKKRKPKKDPNEPHKPVSAYALFFRDTQAAIKGQNPNASFGEVSKIVASMWDNLDTDAKNAYKLKTETAKKDYLKQLAAYRANLLSKHGMNGAVDSYAAQSYAAQAHALQTQSAADSTTAAAEAKEQADVSRRTLASLIAEPTPQHVLTATTTLTVPQSYIPANRMKSDFDEAPPAAPDWAVAADAAAWQPNFQPNERLAQHCRDVFHIWGQPSCQQTQASVPQTGYTPV